MASKIAALADALVADLNAESWTETFTAVRRWLVRWPLDQLATLRVTVVPAAATWEGLDRRRDDKTIDLDIAAQKKVDPGQNTDIDPLVLLLEAIAAHYRNHTLTADGVGHQCTRRAFVDGSDSAVAREHLEDLRAFTGVLRLTFKALQ